MNTRDVVTSYFECVNSGRWDDYVDLFADTIVMDEQLLGRVEGKQQLAAGIEGLRGNPDFRNIPADMVVEGDQAMVRWNIRSPKADGSMLDVKGVNFFRVKDGKIVYFANYHDTKPFE